MLVPLSYRCWRCGWTTSSQLTYAHQSRVLLNLLQDYSTKAAEKGGPICEEDVALLCIKLHSLPIFQPAVTVGQQHLGNSSRIPIYVRPVKVACKDLLPRVFFCDLLECLIKFH